MTMMIRYRIDTPTHRRFSLRSAFHSLPELVEGWRKSGARIRVVGNTVEIQPVSRGAGFPKHIYEFESGNYATWLIALARIEEAP